MGVAGSHGIPPWGKGEKLTAARFQFVNPANFERAQRLKRKADLRRARYHTKHSTSHPHGKRDIDRATRKRLLMDGEFIFWDGESPQDSGYSLFGCSKHPERALCHPYLSTQECLDHLMEIKAEYPTAIHISFGFNLDVSYILKDIPRRAFTQLHAMSRCVWGEWEIWHIPHKWFKVRHGHLEIQVFDIRGFFPGGYVGALLDFNIGTPPQRAELAAGKASRSEFVWANIEEIKKYWALENSMGPLLGDAIRESLRAISMVPASWHGPSAVARMALAKNHVYDAMKVCPDVVREAARYAYAGGRFEPFIVGNISSPIYEYDIRSAYPYYATFLPNLAQGTWRHGKEYEPGKFALYRIRYEEPLDPMKVYPLFRRFKDYSVAWGNRVTGWYWAPEAELVLNDPAATILESLVFDEYDPTDRPFKFLGDYYANRQKAKKRGDPAAYAYKILINALYGLLAQRKGWDRKRRRPPKSHQLEWAGFITSACRAAVYKAAISAGDKLVSINTDSVQTLCSLDNLDCGNNLGQWDEQHYIQGVFWQSGIYYLREDLGYPEHLGYGWVKARTRGIPRGTYSADQLIQAVKTGDVLTINKKMFIGYTQADNGRWDELNTWKTEPHEFAMGGDGKRKHLACAERCQGEIHRLSAAPSTMQVGAGGVSGIESLPHWLPWIDAPSPTKEQFDAIMVEIAELEGIEEYDAA